MKKSLVLITLLSMVFMSGCKTEQNKEVSTEVEVHEDTQLRKNSEYYVLRVTEDSYTKSYNSSDTIMAGDIVRSVSLVVEDLETHERVYLYLETDAVNISDEYKRMVCLVEGDKFKYFGNYDYEVISSK